MMLAVLVEQSQAGKTSWEVISVREEQEGPDGSMNFVRYEHLEEAIHSAAKGKENVDTAVYFYLNGQNYMVPYEIAKDETLTHRWLEEHKLNKH